MFLSYIKHFLFQINKVKMSHWDPMKDSIAIPYQLGILPLVSSTQQSSPAMENTTKPDMRKVEILPLTNFWGFEISSK